MWWIRSDICGLFSAGFTVVLLLYAQWVMVTIVLLPWYGFTLHIPAYTAVTLVALISHCRAQFTDPGAVPLDRLPPATPALVLNARGEEVPAPPPRVCRRCRVMKPFKAHHCSSCGRCIVRMDHHCPWVNNCVAALNQKYFLLFLIYTCLACIYSGTLLVARFISCTNHLSSCTISGAQAVLCVLNFVEAVVFGLFCLIMLWDQVSAILENTPGIDAMQNRKGEARAWYVSLQEVFGERLCWRWWLPVDLPPSVRLDFLAELNQLEDPITEAAREAQRARQYERHQQQQANGVTTSHAANGTTGGESIADAHQQRIARGPIVFPDVLHAPPLPMDLLERELELERRELALGRRYEGVINADGETDPDDEDEEDDDDEGVNPLLAALRTPPHAPDAMARAYAQMHAQQREKNA